MSELDEKQSHAQDAHEAHDAQDTVRSEWVLPATYAFILSYILATTYAVFSMGFFPVLSLHIIVLFLCIAVVQVKFDEIQNTVNQCIDVIEDQVDIMYNMLDSIEHIAYKVGIVSTDETQSGNKPT